MNFPTVRIFEIQILWNIELPSFQISKILFSNFANFLVYQLPIFQAHNEYTETTYFRLVPLSFRSLKKGKKKEKEKKISMGSVKV